MHKKTFWIMNKKTQKIGEQVIEVLCGIHDPEIPVNIYELYQDHL